MYLRSGEILFNLKCVIHIHGQSDLSGVSDRYVVGDTISAEESVLVCILLLRRFGYPFLLHLVLRFPAFRRRGIRRKFIRWGLYDDLTVLHLYDLLGTVRIDNKLNVVAVIIAIDGLYLVKCIGCTRLQGAGQFKLTAFIRCPFCNFVCFVVVSIRSLFRSLVNRKDCTG